MDGVSRLSENRFIKRLNENHLYDMNILSKATPIAIMVLLLFSHVFAQEDLAIEGQISPSSSEYMQAIKENLDVKLLFPSRVPDRIILNLTEDPHHSAAVNWRTSIAQANGEVEVAVASDGIQFVQNVRKVKAKTERLVVTHDVNPDVEAHYHAANIEGLSPGTRYVYRVGHGEHWSEWFQFDLPALDQPLTFLYYGDAQNSVKTHWSRLIREAYRMAPQIDFMLHAGDLINRHNNDHEWGEWFHAGGYIHATVPSVMTPGNHEYGRAMDLSPQWQPQFNLPQNGPEGLEETCYQVNFPQLKVVSLNSQQINETPMFREKQLHWLDSVLREDPRAWTVITLHHPFYSTKPNRDNKELRASFKPIIDKYKVDLVLQGHDHAYGRGMIGHETQGNRVGDDVSGTVYVVSNAGPKMYEASDDPWMDRKGANIQLFQIIEIYQGVLKFESYTATGELYDAFLLIKQSDGSKQLVNNIPETPEKL